MCAVRIAIHCVQRGPRMAAGTPLATANAKQGPNTVRAYVL